MSATQQFVASPELEAARDLQTACYETLHELRQALQAQAIARHNLLLAGPNSGLTSTGRRLEQVNETQVRVRRALEAWAAADTKTVQALAILMDTPAHTWHTVAPEIAAAVASLPEPVTITEAAPEAANE